MLNHLYQVVRNSHYARDSEGKKSNPKVVRAKLDTKDVIVGEPSPFQDHFLA